MTATPRVPNAIGENKYPFLSNMETGITAYATGGQANATKLTAQISRVDTVASGNDSVALPKITAAPGKLGSLGSILFVSNNASNSMQVFGQTPDTVNGVATGTGVAVAGGVNVWFVAVSYNVSTNVGTWLMTNSQSAAVAAITSGTIAGVAISGSTIATSSWTDVPKFTSISATVSAHAGGGQGSATALSSAVNYVSTCASDHDSVKLPAATGSGAVYLVTNGTAKICDVYPSTSGNIAGLGANNPLSLAVNTGSAFVDVAANVWGIY